MAFDSRSKGGRRFLATVPFFATAIFFYYLFKAEAVKAKFVPAAETIFSGLFAKLAVAAQIVVFYVARTLFVREIVGEYATKFSGSLGDGRVLLSFLAIAVALGAAIALRRKYPSLLFGSLLYLVLLIPVLNFFKTSPVVADRYAYLPCVGLFFAVTALPIAGRKVLVTSICMVLAIWWSLVSVKETRYWKNDITLGEHNATYAPSPKISVALGFAYFYNQEYDKAYEQLSKVRDMAPYDRFYDLFMGEMAFQRKDYPGAIRAYEAVLEKVGSGVMRKSSFAPKAF